MATYLHSMFREGDLVGTRDIGVTAWTIRWQTAGWGQRDNMDVWVHVGVMTDQNDDGRFEIADMYVGRKDYAFGINSIDTYMNGPGGNPSINDIRRSPAIAGSWSVQQYMKALCALTASKPAKYDWGALFGSIGGLRVWNSNSKYLCTEMAFQLICMGELASGYRFVTPTKGYMPGILNNYRGSGAKQTDYNWRNINSKVMWNMAFIGDMTTPWNMKRSCTVSAGIIPRTSFYGDWPSWSLIPGWKIC